jgi:hypothetical protein
MKSRERTTVRDLTRTSHADGPLRFRRLAFQVPVRDRHPRPTLFCVSHARRDNSRSHTGVSPQDIKELVETARSSATAPLPRDQFWDAANDINGRGALAIQSLRRRLANRCSLIILHRPPSSADRGDRTNENPGIQWTDRRLCCNNGGWSSAFTSCVAVAAKMALVRRCTNSALDMMAVKP